MSNERERICGIYLIRNTDNGKAYVGQSRDILDRFVHHKSDLRHNRHRNRYLQKSYNKYGEGKFEYSILEECTLDEINERESYWIAFYHSNESEYGYNADSGGNAKKVVSESTRQLISMRLSEALKGRKLPEEWKENIRKSRIGKKWDDEAKRKMSESKKGKSNKNSGNFKKGQTPWNKGLTLSDVTKSKVSESLKEYYAQFKIEPTPEMIEDVKSGMSRRKFEAKYGGHQSLWRELYRSYRKEVA